MPQLFNIPEYGLVSYPDDATPDEIQAHIDQYFAPRVEQIFTDRADRIERGRQAEGYEPPSAIRSAAESIGGAIAQLPSRLGRDLPLDIASGIVAVPEAAVGLADIPTGGRAGRLAEDLGVDFKGTKSYFESLQSPERQEERQRIQAAEGWKDTALQIAQSPGTVLGAVASSLPLMGSGAAVASKVTQWAPKLGALGTALSKVPAPAIGEGLVAAGSAAEQIRQQTPDRLLTPTQSALAAATGVATGGLGVLGGKAAAKLGVDDIDAIMSGAMPVNQKGSVLASVLKGALTEGVLEELPQSVSEQFFQNVALGRPRDEALAEAAVLGLLSGSLTGGALQPYLINEARRTKAAQDLLTQRQQVQDNLAKIRDDAEKLRQRSGALPPTLPASPTPSAPTTATRGPTGAPAPTVDAPLAGESPLPPSAPAAPAAPPTADTGTPFDVIERMTQDEYADWIAKGGGNVNGQGAIYKELVKRPEFRGGRSASTSDLTEASRLLRALENTEGFSDSSEGWTFRRFGDDKTKNPDGTRSKAYLTLDNWKSLTPEALKALANELEVAGYQGQLKVPGAVPFGAWRLAEGFDNVVAHGRTPKDVELFAEIAGRLFPKAKLSYGLDPKGTSHTDALASAANKSRIALKTGKGSVPFTPLPRQFFTPTPTPTPTPAPNAPVKKQPDAGQRTYYQAGVSNRGGLQYLAENVNVANAFAEGGEFGRAGAKVALVKANLNIFDQRNNPGFLTRKELPYTEPDGLINWTALEGNTDLIERLQNAGFDAIRVSEGPLGSSVAVLPKSVNKLVRGPLGEPTTAPQPPTPTPAPQPGATKLPAELSKAKPRYSYGEKKFLPTFASDIDLALYTVAQKTTSKRDADYLKFLVDSLGLPEKEVRALGTRFRDDVIKPLAARAEGGTAAKPAPLSIPPFYSAKPPTPAPNAPAAVRQQPGVPVQPAQAPQGGVSPKAGAGDSAVGAKAKPAAKEAEPLTPEERSVIAAIQRNSLFSSDITAAVNRGGSLKMEEYEVISTLRGLQRRGIVRLGPRNIWQVTSELPKQSFAGQKAWVDFNVEQARSNEDPIPTPIHKEAKKIQTLISGRVEESGKPVKQPEPAGLWTKLIRFLKADANYKLGFNEIASRLESEGLSGLASALRSLPGWIQAREIAVFDRVSGQESDSYRMSLGNYGLLYLKDKANLHELGHYIFDSLPDDIRARLTTLLGQHDLAQALGADDLRPYIESYKRAATSSPELTTAHELFAMAAENWLAKKVGAQGKPHPHLPSEAVELVNRILDSKTEPSIRLPEGWANQGELYVPPQPTVQPAAQPAPAQPAPVQPVAQPVSSAEEFEAALGRMKANGDLQAVETFQKLQEDWRVLPGRPPIDALANLATLYASGELDKPISKIALLMGLDSVPKLRVLAAGSKDLSSWGDTSRKTGGFLVKGEQIYLDPYAYYRDLVSDQPLLFKTVAHELWHVILDRVTLQMSGGDRANQNELYRKLYDAVPQEFKAAAAKTPWGSSSTVIVDEFLRAVLEKNASPLLKNFADLVDPKILAALAKAQTTEEISLVKNPQLMEALTKSVIDFDLTRSKVLGKLKPGIFAGIKQAFVDLLNAIKGTRREAGDPLVQVIDAALKAAKVEAPRNRLKAAKVREAKAAAPAPAKAAEPKAKGKGGRYAKDADVAAIKADVSQQKLIRFASEMTRLEQMFLERNPKLFEKFQQALSQDVLRDLPEQGRAADDFYSALARQTEKMLASVTPETQELPPKFVPQLKQIRETKGRIASEATSLEALQEQGGVIPEGSEDVRVGANEGFSWMMFRLAQLAAAERMAGGPKSALALAVLNAIRSVRDGGITDAKAFSPEFKITLGMRQLTLLQAAEELGLPPLPTPGAGMVATRGSLEAWNQQVRQAFEARPQTRVIDEWLRLRRRELSLEGMPEADREALFARLSAVSRALDRRDQELLTLLENDAIEGVRLDVRYSLPVAQGDEEYLRLAQDPVGNREALQRMVDEAARKAGVPILDDSASEAFRARRTAPPKKTIKAYKLFATKPGSPGKLFPLFVGANEAIPQSVWLDAIAGKEAAPSKTGKLQVKSKLGPLAYRPGWHAGDIPLATHIGVKNEAGKVFARRSNEVWAEVELAADTDYQPRADASKTKDLREMPVDGAYRFKTNPNMTGSWIISGSMKINRVLSQPEVDNILRKAGVETMPWDGGALDLERLRLSTEVVSNKLKLNDPITYDDNGNVIPLSQRFQPTEPDIRYSLPVAQGDEEYLRLAQDPVGNREALQRMVDEAAKAAGLSDLATTVQRVPLQEFDFSYVGTNEDGTAILGPGIYLSSVDAKTPAGEDFATYIYGKRSDLPAQKVFIRSSEISDPRKGLVDRNKWDAAAQELGYSGIDDLNEKVRGVSTLRDGSWPVGGVVKLLGKAQARRLLVKHDILGLKERLPSGVTEYAVYSPEAIKSADPVTYDDNGNVIPLSQRFQPTEQDIRYSLPVAQGDEDLGAAETRLRGAFTRILDQVLLPARERDEDLYTNTLYQAARTRLKELERKVDDYQLSVGQDPVSLASDEFEDIVASAEFQNSISSLSTGLLGRLGSLMQDRANVLEERAARQLASDMVRLEDAQALLEFWQTVDQTAPGVAAIVKRLQNKAEKLANAVKDPPADRLERAMQIKRSEDTKIDRAAAARAQSGPLLEWLRSAGSAELVSEILSQEPFRAEVVLAERGPRTTAVVGANAPGMSGPLGSETPQITPAYSLAGLLGRALDAFTASGAGGLGLRRLLDGFDRQRRAANAALASKEAQALAREIVQISQEIKQAHANLGQGRLDLRAVLRTFDGRTNESASMRFTRKELQELANLDEAAEQSALQLVSLIQDNRNPALAGAVLDLLARPSKGAASPAESAERVPSTAELAKLLAKELGLSENTLNVLLGAMAKSNPVREAFSALVDRKLGVPLIYELNYLESATKAFNEAAEKFRATPVAEDAKKEFQAALDARDAAINRVLVPLRNRLQSQGANVRGLESRLLAKLIQQRTLQMTAEAFETIASDPEFNRARFNIESATAQDYSLYRLIKPTNDGFSFAAFGLRDPKTGELIPKTGAESFAWTPKDLESGKVEQLRNYFDQAAKLLDLYHAAEMAYRTDPDTVPSPAQLGYDARTMQALALMLERDAPDFYSPELRSPELARGAVGFMDATPLTRKLWRAWVSMPGFFGGLSKVGLEVFSYQLPGQAGALLRDKLGKVTTLQSNLRGLFAQAMSPGKRGAQGLEQKLRKAMESHGVDQYGVPVLTAEQYRLKVMNPLGSLGRTASTQRHPLKVGDEIPGSDQKVTQADLDFMQAESDFTKSVYTLLVRTGRADRFIVEGGFSRNPLANWIYNINRSVSDRLQEFVNRVAELERSSPGASLTKGDAAAMDFWARPENFQLVLAHVRDALLDPAEDAVAHRPGVREAMAEAARSVDSATNLTEVVQLLGATRAAARAGLSPAALQSALNDELDQLLNNAREMVSVELDDTISEGYFKRQGISTDNQFTSPFGPRKLPSSLYNYGNLTQRDHDRFLRNAEKLEMVDLLNALEFANQQLDALLKGYERGDAAVKREFESRFTDPDEARVLLTQGKQLHKDLMTKASGAANLATNWLSKVYTGLALGKPPVWLFNGATAPYMFSEQMRTIDVGGFVKPRRESVKMAARLAKLTGRSALAYTVGKLSEQVAKVAAKNGIKSSSLNWMLSKGLELADRERIMRDELRGLGGSDRLDFWVEYDRAKDVLQVDGIVSDDLPETYRSWDNWLSRRGLDPVRAFGTAALKKVNTSVADMRINSAIMLGMDSLSESFAVVADRYLTRLENAGKLDRNNFKGALQELLKPGADFQGLAVTAADFGGTNGRKSDEARLQRLRQWLTLAGFPSPEQMFLDYYARRTTNPQTSFFNSDQMRALLQKVVADTNSPTLANRPLAFQVDGNTAELFKLMGYGTNAIFQAAVAPVRVRRTMAEGGHVVDLQQFFWLTGSIPMLMLYGSAAVGLRELWRRYMQNRGRSVDTIFDPDVYNDPRRVGRMILRNAVAAVPFPVLGDVLNWMVQADPFGRGIDPVDRLVVSSLIRLIMSETANTWTSLQPVASGEFGEAATRLLRQGLRLGNQLLPFAAETSGALARSGVAMEGPVRMMQQSSAERLAASQAPGILKPGVAVASAKAAMTPNPFRDPMRMMLEAQVEKNPAKYEEGMRYFVRALQEKNAERIKRGQDPITLEEQLRASSEGYVPFKYTAPGATQTEIASAMAVVPESSRQAIMERQAMVSNVRGGEEVRLGVQPRGQAAGGGSGGGGGGALPTSSLRLPGIGRVSVGGGGGGGGSRLSRSRRRRPRLTLGGRGRNLSRLRVRRLRSPRNRLLRRRRA